jgi:hypothetical protein
MGQSDVRELRSFGARLRKFVKVIGEADLTAAVNGTAQDIALGFLPEGAIMPIPPSLKLTTQFTGGAASAVGLTIGTAAAPTLLATNFDIFGGTASGLFVAMTQGAQVAAPASGQSIIARITPDGAHQLVNLTAGALTLEVYYQVPDPT